MFDQPSLLKGIQIKNSYLSELVSYNQLRNMQLENR